MSQAAADGGMPGSGGDDDNAGDKKEMGKVIAENPDQSPPSSDSGSDQGQDDQTAEADSKPTGCGTLYSLASLEASLPMKRGLSRHYDGRSKSFGNLNELALEDAKGLGKTDHPLNKRRRLMLAHEYYDKTLHGGGSSGMAHASSMPIFPSAHNKNEKNEDDNKEEEGNDGDKKKNQEEDGK